MKEIRDNVDKLLKDILTTVNEHSPSSTSFTTKVDIMNVYNCDTYASGAVAKFSKMAEEISTISDLFAATSQSVIVVTKFLSELSDQLINFVKFFNVVGNLAKVDVKSDINILKTTVSKATEYKRVCHYAARASKTLVLLLIIISTFIEIFESFIDIELKNLMLYLIDDSPSVPQPVRTDRQRIDTYLRDKETTTRKFVLDSLQVFIEKS